MRVKVIAGWSVTVLLVLAVVSGGVAELVHRPDNVAGIVHLGYPEYLATLLGAGKLLGAVAIVTPGFPVLREWAYAGVFFNMAGAAFSHLMSGDPAWRVAVTLGLAGLALASRALRAR